MTAAIESGGCRPHDVFTAAGKILSTYIGAVASIATGEFGSSVYDRLSVLGLIQTSVPIQRAEGCLNPGGSIYRRILHKRTSNLGTDRYIS